MKPILAARVTYFKTNIFKTPDRVVQSFTYTPSDLW